MTQNRFSYIIFISQETPCADYQKGLLIMKLSDFASNLDISITKRDGRFYASGKYIDGEEDWGATLDDIVDNLQNDMIDDFLDKKATAGVALFMDVIYSDGISAEDVYKRDADKYGRDDVAVIMLGALLNPTRFLEDDLI